MSAWFSVSSNTYCQRSLAELVKNCECPTFFLRLWRSFSEDQRNWGNGNGGFCKFQLDEFVLNFLDWAISASPYIRKSTTVSAAFNLKAYYFLTTWCYWKSITMGHWNRQSLKLVMILMMRLLRMKGSVLHALTTGLPLQMFVHFARRGFN
ncbi:uncharacterized protein LOC122081834 isoform X1 [Macadamia integrifolia]|uniref:uncharacterized protein LOC122081834 isoform X1 n=1 Tax=Macadamia integrifolia TaxID=60698 RepID=UPI001C4ED93F|nr:uncharacterized protein LOC122081834 isoform X1 [Macadamia integrifolia]